MRIRIRFPLDRAFDPPPRTALLLLRLSPRPHHGQHVLRWRLDLDVDGLLRADEDAYGNATHLLEAKGSPTRLDILVDGEVETADTAGMLRGAVERVPLGVFLRETRLCTADEPVRDLAERARAATATPLAFAHELSALVSDAAGVRSGGEGDAAHPGGPFFDGSDAGLSRRAAPAILAAGRGDAADLTHLLVAAARSAGVPARAVLGFRVPEGDGGAGARLHGWAELHVEGFGWIGFDPNARACPTERYLRLAAGPDLDEIAPVRGPGRTLGPPTGLEPSPGPSGFTQVQSLGGMTQSQG